MRKTPIRHLVRQHARKGGVVVRTHQRGSGSRTFSPKDFGTQSYLGVSRKKVVDFSRGGLSEKEVNLIKTRLNSDRMSISEVRIPDGGLKLDTPQIEKGRDWLMNKWKSPTGKERVNNPFGYREEHVLNPANFNTIKLVDFRDLANYNQSRMGIKFYVPTYRVIGKDGSTFEYNVQNGEVDLTG